MKIALCGIAGSGKDYLARSLHEKDYHIISFGAKLKQICADIFPYLIENPIESDKIVKEYGKSHREIWIKIAKSIREVDNMAFVNFLLNSPLSHLENVVITDLRDEIEFNALILQGFIPIFIKPELSAMKPANSYDDRISIIEKKIKHVFINDFKGIQTISLFLKFIEKISK